MQQPLSFPYEIRARIWQSAAPSTPTDIACCKEQKTTSHTRCIRPFTEILEAIDPLHVTRYASKPSSPNAKFVFCSMSCFATAMRVSNAKQRQIMSKGWICVAYSRNDVEHILSASDAATMPKSVEIRTPMTGGSYAEIGEEVEGEGEGRLTVVRAKMFRKMERMAKKYFGGGGRVLVSHWSGMNGGHGCVEMLL